MDPKQIPGWPLDKNPGWPLPMRFAAAFGRQEFHWTAFALGCYFAAECYAAGKVYGTAHAPTTERIATLVDLFRDIGPVGTRDAAISNLLVDLADGGWIDFDVSPDRRAVTVRLTGLAGPEDWPH